MFRKSLMLCASLLFVGCDAQTTPEDEFREGLPSKQMVQVKEPGGSAGQRLERDEVSGLALGQRSDFYTFTRGATVIVNGGTAFVLNLLEEVTKHTPTTLQGDVAVWGPYTDALSPNTWKLTVTKTADNTYDFKLEGKGKSEADSSFKTILSGSHTISVDEQGNRLRDFGNGTLTIDWDAAQTLPEHDNNIGTLAIRYARPDAKSVVSVDAAFRNVKDDERPGTRVSADYLYKETPGAGGEFDFGLSKNFDTDASRPAVERLTIKSRWAQSGAGRADVKITGGDFGFADARVSECWDANFASQYLEASWVTTGPVYGAVTACGALATPIYSSL